MTDKISGPPRPPTPSPAVSCVRIAADPEGKGWRIGVVGKRTWKVSGRSCYLAEEQRTLVEEPVYDEARAVVLHDADVLLNRSKADIVVAGHVYPPSGITPLDVLVQVGAFARRAKAFGPRRATLAAGRVYFSPPGRIDKIPLDWESAYGGVDFAARADIGDPFEESLAQAGVAPGSAIRPLRLSAQSRGAGVPHRTDEGRIRRVRAAVARRPRLLAHARQSDSQGLRRLARRADGGGVRVALLRLLPAQCSARRPPLVYDGMRIPPTGFFEVASGEVHAAAVRPDRPPAERANSAVTQSSAIGMRAVEVQPGDAVVLHGMHPREPHWTFALPLERPRMYVRFANEAPIELPAPLIRTVFLEPDEERLTLVWTSELAQPMPPGARRLEGLRHGVIWR